MTPVLVLALQLAAPAAAQAHKVTAGVLAYEQGDYPAARTALEAALAGADDLRDERRNRAELYLARTLWKHVVQPDLEVPEGARARALDLYQACAQGHERWRRDCEEEAGWTALSLFNQAASGDAEAAEALVTAWPESWLGPYAQGAVGLTRDAPHAELLAVFSDGWSRVLAGAPPDHPELVYGLFDMLVRTHNAVDGPEAGLALLTAEAPKLRERLGAHGWSKIEEQVTEFQGRFERTVAQVESYREAAASPDATAAQLLQWAGVLAQVGTPEQAAAAYENATTRFPEDPTAWFDRGAFHYNRAAGLDDMEAMKPHMALARPALEKAVSLDPDNGRAVTALRQACLVLEDEGCLRAVDAAAGSE